MEPVRCAWAPWPSELMMRYHDEEWGVPCHDDRALFELLVLEGAQAGLSWNTILNKRANYRRSFDGFDFVGPTICYSFRQAAGLITAQEVTCFRYKQL